MRRHILLLFLFISNVAWAQEFDECFVDSTLRIDYIFSGDVNAQNISVDKMNVSPRWYGKRKRLADVPTEGNGHILVKDHRTGQVLYRNSFSTLFQEWLSYDEAQRASKAFENVFLVPLPRDTADITVVLYNNRRETMTQLTHTFVPNDILIRHIGEKDITPYVTLHQAQDTARCIHIAIVAEGYTQDEMDTYLADAQRAVDALFSHEPFHAMSDRFNIVAVESPSRESGTSEPAKGAWKDTVLGSHFDTFYMSRYLTTLNLKDLHDILAGVPYEHIIILVNTDEYGGGGILNSYVLTMTHHDKFLPVVVHEFGHSFAGLADEYAYESEQIPMYLNDVEPWEKNITTLVDFSAKWQDMMNRDGVALYEGAGYSLEGVYRPAEDCRMRTNEYPEFCPVCQHTISRLIEFYTE